MLQVAYGNSVSCIMQYRDNQKHLVVYCNSGQEIN